tara:strand:+ start:1821 stop:5582 length:3762 start_codon:yes stop_codon:yes gene_type:complete
VNESSTQTKLLGEILKQLQHNANSSVGGSMSSGQADTLQKMTKMIDGVNRALNHMDSSSEKVVGSLSHATAMMETYGTVLGTAGLAFQQMNKASGGILEKVAKMTGLKKIWTSIHGSLGGIVKNTKTFGEELKKADTRLKKVYATANMISGMFGTLSKTVFGLGAGIVSIGKTILTSVVGAFTAATTAAVKFSKFVYTLPIGIANRAADLGNQLRKEFEEVIGQAKEDTKEYFDSISDGGQAIDKLTGTLSKNILKFENVNSSLMKLFGQGAGGIAKAIGEISKGMNDTGLFFDIFASSMANSSDSMEFFITMSKGLAMGAEETNYVMREAIANGEHYQTTMMRIYNASDSASKQFGVDRKRLSKNYFQLRKDITNFGHLSEIELMRVTARATQMGVEIKDLASVFNKFGTFEEAANSAALLSQTFGMNIDALQLLRAEDPMQIVDMFRHAMMATGRTFNMLNRHEKALMATHTGMSVESLKTVMNYRNAGKSYEQIKKIMKDKRPEERQIKAMKDVRSSVVQLQKIIDKKDFFKSFLDGVSKTIMYNTSLGQSYQTLSKNIQSFFTDGISLNKDQKKSLDGIVLPFSNSLDRINKIFDPESKGFIDFKTKVLAGLSDLMTKVSVSLFKKGEECLSEPAVKGKVKAWEKKYSEIFSFKNVISSNTFLGNLAKETGRLMGYLVKAFTVVGPGIIKGLGNALLAGVRFLTGQDLGADLSGEIANFLFPDDVCKEQALTAFQEALKSIKVYMFGPAGTKAGFKEGLIYKLFVGTSGAITNITKEGGPLSNAVNETGSLLGDVFKSLGKTVIEGMSEATLALEEVGRLIGRGVARAFGLGVKEQTISATTLPDGSTARAVKVSSAVGAADKEMSMQDPLAPLGNIRNKYVSGGRGITGFVRGSIQTLQEVDKAALGAIEFNKDDDYFTGLLKALGQIAYRGATLPFTTARFAGASDLFGDSGNVFEDIKEQSTFRSGGNVQMATFGVRQAIKAAGKQTLKRIPYITLLAEIAEGVDNVDQAAKQIAKLRNKGYLITKSEEESIMTEVAKSQALDTTFKAAGGVGGGLAGAKGGAALGTMILPGVGTVIGGFLGGALGYFAGSSFASGFSNDAQEELEEQLAKRNIIGDEMRDPKKIAIYRGMTTKATDDLDPHVIANLQAIASLDSQRGISKEDLDLMMTTNREDQQELVRSFKEFLASDSHQTTLQLKVDDKVFAEVMLNRIKDFSTNQAMNPGQFNISGGFGDRSQLLGDLGKSN